MENNWRQYIESTDEVSVFAVADSLGISGNDILKFVSNEGHGARYVGGLSKHLISREDAAKIEHIIKYDRLCHKHGLAWNEKSPRLVNESLESLIEKFKEDPHLNNVPLKLWDHLAYSFLCFNQSSSLSLSEAVCMQKHAARKLIKKYI